MVITMFEFTFNFFQIINFMLIFAIFSICSLIYINSKQKYDVVASILFLKRDKLKNLFFVGYLGIILLFTGNFFSSLSMGLISEFLDFFVIFGLILILVLIYRIHLIIYTSMKLNAKIYEKIT